MAEITSLAKHTTKNVFYFTLGLVSFFLCGVLFFLCIPLLLYRWVVTRLIAPYFFRNSLGNVVDVLGTIPSTEFLLPVQSAPKNTILVTMTLDKPITYDAFYKLANEQWICARDPAGKLKYPEFTQYLESWMGFMFWKPEPSFCLKTHIKFHKINDLPTEKILDQLNKKLLNEPYLEKTSPWEVHLIEHDDSTDRESEFFVILRIHHAIADGFSILHLLAEQLCGSNLETVLKSASSKPKPKYAVGNLIVWPINFYQTLGRTVCLIIEQQKVVCRTYGDNVNSYQICKRTKPFSVEMVKQIKNKFGVSFTAVQYAAFAAAMSKISARFRIGDRIITKLPVISALPVPNHERRLTNQMMGAVYSIPLNPELTSYEGLQNCHKAIQREQNLQVLAFMYYMSCIVSSLPIKLVRRLFKNHSTSIIASTLAAPEISMRFLGSQYLAGDYAVGSLPIGNGAITFSSISYVDKLRILVTAETAVVSENDMEKMVNLMENEIEILNALACITG